MVLTRRKIAVEGKQGPGKRTESVVPTTSNTKQKMTREKKSVPRGNSFMADLYAEFSFWGTYDGR